MSETILEKALSRFPGDSHTNHTGPNCPSPRYFDQVRSISGGQAALSWNPWDGQWEVWQFKDGRWDFQSEIQFIGCDPKKPDERLLECLRYIYSTRRNASAEERRAEYKSKLDRKRELEDAAVEREIDDRLNDAEKDWRRNSDKIIDRYIKDKNERLRKIAKGEMPPDRPAPGAIYPVANMTDVWAGEGLIEKKEID